MLSFLFWRNNYAFRQTCCNSNPRSVVKFESFSFDFSDWTSAFMIDSVCYSKFLSNQLVLKKHSANLVGSRNMLFCLILRCRVDLLRETVRLMYSSNLCIFCAFVSMSCGMNKTCTFDFMRCLFLTRVCLVIVIFSNNFLNCELGFLSLESTKGLIRCLKSNENLTRGCLW